MILAAVGLSLAGCAADGPVAVIADAASPGSEGSPGGFPAVLVTSTTGPDARTVASALAGLRSDLDVTGAAESVLVGACARRAGFPVRPSDPAAEPDPASVAALPSPSPEAAARSGYGIADRVLTRQTAADQQSWAGAGEAYEAGITLAIFGDPSDQVEVTFDDGYTARIGADGCYADVRRALFGDLTEYARQSWAASQAFGRATAAVAQDGAWTEGAAAWSDCMTAAGHPGFASSGEVRLALFARVAAIEVTSPADRVERFRSVADDERVLAARDAECARSTGLDQRWIDVVAANDTAALTRDASEILVWAQTLAQLAPRARESAVVAAGS